MDSETEAEIAGEPKTRWVFDLRAVFYVVSLLAVGLAISPGTIVVSLLVLFFWWCCFAATRSSKTGLTLGVVALGFLLLVCCFGMLIPAMESVREAARRITCQGKMRQLGVALLNYQSANGQFPEASTMVGENPYSWRVGLLPFIEQQKIHARYDFAEPWDLSLIHI